MCVCVHNNNQIPGLTHNSQIYDPVGLWKAEEHLFGQQEAEEVSGVGGVVSVSRGHTGLFIQISRYYKLLAIVYNFYVLWPS